MSEEKSGESIWRKAYGRLPEPLRRRLASATERRWLPGGLVALVAVVLLVVLPGYAGSRPEFLKRYPRLEPEYRSWAVSTHAEVACQACHVPPGTPRTVYRARMLGEFYASMVLPQRRPDLFGKPGNAACEQCHRDIRQASPSGDLKIPHRAHVQVLKLECVHCHSFVVHGTNPEGSHSPRMATCMECHDGRQAKSDCSACHKFKDEPPSHKAKSWLIEHPDKQADIDCKSCHAWTEDWCRECHAKRPASHAGKWRGTHRDAVAKHRNCEACHRADFCVRCHGELPQQNFDPSLKYVQ